MCNRAPQGSRKGVVFVLLTTAAVAAAAVISRWEFPPSSRMGPPLQIPKSQAPPPGSATAPPPARAARFSPPVRVNLTPVPVKSVEIAVDGPYQLRSNATETDSNRVLRRGNRLAAIDVTVTPAGFRVGSAEHEASGLEIVAERPPSIWVGEHQYRGRVRLFRRPEGTLIAVNELPLEEYVASVVDGEMPASFPDAARQAQAIVARTYALYRRQEARNHPFFDLYATTRSQKYLGFQYRTAAGRRLAGESENSRKRTEETAGLVCTWNGKLFCTYYSAVCGGGTTRGDRVFADAAPPLQSVACDWCRPAERYRWTTRLSRSDVSQSLARYFAANDRPFGKLVSMKRLDAPATPASRPLLGGNHQPPRPPATFEVSDGRRRYSLSAADLRRHLPPSTLHSPRFTVRETADTVIFEGRGHGHGVGLCQWGACGQGRAGRNFLQILHHYYPGMQLVAIKPAPASGGAEPSR